MEIILAEPRGFCAGVERAIKIVDEALLSYPGKDIYVFHEIVHNKYVLSDFQKKGVRFVESIEDVPNDSVLIFSAHGVPKQIINDAKNSVKKVIDATCPLVTKVHLEAQKNEKNGLEIILIGHKNHQEVVGTIGQTSKAKIKLVESVDDVWNLDVDNPDRLSYITQTTLSIDDTLEIITTLKEKYPNIRGQNLKDICYATQNRQNVVKELIKLVDVILVIGSKNSSNSTRLTEIGLASNIPSYLIDNKNDIDLSWFRGSNKIGITAGASAPEILVQQIIDFFKSSFHEINVHTIDGIKENIKFKLPII